MNRSAPADLFFYLTFPETRARKDQNNMINPRFEKKAFKKEVEQNVKQLFRKTVDEVSQQELIRQFLCRKRCNYR